MRTKPWHSEKDTRHHNNAECSGATRIPKSERKIVTGKKPLCNECAKLVSTDP